MILATLKDKLEDAGCEWTGGEHIVIGHYPSGQRLEIDEIREDDDGVINIITGGRCAGDVDKEMMVDVLVSDEETS